MKDYIKIKIFIMIIAIGFLFIGCAGVQPIPTAELPVFSEAPERQMSIHGFAYEGILDIAFLMQGDWGEAVWRNVAYMPVMMELYYRNPEPSDGRPHYACVMAGQRGIMGFAYMIGDELHTFRVDGGGFAEYEPTPAEYKTYIDDFATAVGHYRDKKGT